ncbi:MAG: hypothetical protein IPP81_19180 [Chitinophagaceae bacterium]|nr:hypothetical protein [Chitinophagaceae bacterium]
MTPEHQHTAHPTLEEIMAASKPGIAAEQRASIKEKLAGYIPADESLAGAIRFLEDHQYDFDALHDFLETPAVFSTLKIKSTHGITVRRFTVAAACLVILSGAAWYYLNRETPAKIIAKSVFHEPGLPVFASMQGNKEFHELMSAYKMQDPEIGPRLLLRSDK